MGARSRHAEGKAHRQLRPCPRRTSLWALSPAVVAPTASLGISSVVARKLAFSMSLAIEQTPASFGLDYRTVAFLSRQDAVLLRGWLIPGIDVGGQPRLERSSEVGA